MNYYQSQLNEVRPELTEYPPTIKIFANGNGLNTNNISLNQESCEALIFWLANNFLNDQSLQNTINKLKTVK